MQHTTPPADSHPQNGAPPHGTPNGTSTSPLTCPHCGQPQGGQLDPQLSAVIDWLESLDATMHAIRAVVEEVLP